MSMFKIESDWREIQADQKAVKNECKKILLEADKTRFITPVAKARVLERVCKTYLFEANSFSFDDDELQAAACMKVLQSIKSEREFFEVLRIIGKVSGKGNSSTFIENFRMIFDGLLFQSKQKNIAQQWLRNRTFTDYAFLE